MKKKTTGYHMDGLIALLLFGVFAACLLAVLLTGAGAYKRLNTRNEESYVRRTCIQYVTNRVHQAPKPADVKVEAFGNGNALSIADGDDFVTRVYFYDGYYADGCFLCIDQASRRKKICVMADIPLPYLCRGNRKYD